MDQISARRDKYTSCRDIQTSLLIGCDNTVFVDVVVVVVVVA